MARGFQEADQGNGSLSVDKSRAQPIMKPAEAFVLDLVRALETISPKVVELPVEECIPMVSPVDFDAKHIRISDLDFSRVTSMQTWERGTRVRKISGDTHPSGTVLGEFETLRGLHRVVVELDYAELLHIYSPEQLQAVPKTDEGAK